MSVLNALHRFAVEFSAIYEHARTGRAVSHHGPRAATTDLPREHRDNALMRSPHQRSRKGETT